MEIIFSTQDNETGNRTLKQHAYISKEINTLHETYEGNKQLCTNGGVHDGNKYVKLSQIKAELISNNCCRKCFNIYINLL